MTHLVNFNQNGKLDLALGQEIEPSCLWTVEIGCDERMGHVKFRLTDDQSTHAYASLVTSVITSGTTDLTLIEVGADRHHPLKWEALHPNHFQFGLAADVMRRSGLHIININGVRAFVMKALRALLDANKLTNAYVAVASQQSDLKLAMALPGLARSVGSRTPSQAKPMPASPQPVQIQPTPLSQIVQQPLAKAPPAPTANPSGQAGSTVGGKTAYDMNGIPVGKQPLAPRPRLPRRNSELKRWF